MGEVKQTLEELLNKLIDRGWNPWGIEDIDEILTHTYKCNKALDTVTTINYGYDDKGVFQSICFDRDSINDLCSIDSGLRQFVCKHNLVSFEEYRQFHHQERDVDTETYLNTDRLYENDKYIYRLMLSSIQEDKEQFLLSNIKLDD